MVLFFIYDELTDKVDGDGARVYPEMVMDATRDPHKENPQGVPKLGEIARQYVSPPLHFSYFIDLDRNRFWRHHDDRDNVMTTVSGRLLDVVRVHVLATDPEKYTHL